ncbi:MAG: GGDEF domain-containing protein, partial [Nannocystaceae bacterium]
FENRLESDVAFALRHGKPLSVIAFNLDNFREVNDTHGVAVGDTVLRDVANRVRGTIRGEDVFARVGGEDFVVICRDVDATRAANAAQRIRGLISDKPFNIMPEGLHVTVSLGVADLGMLPSPSGQALYIASERALASAKTQGRNLACVYDPQGQPTRLV